MKKVAYTIIFGVILILLILPISLSIEKTEIEPSGEVVDVPANATNTPQAPNEIIEKANQYIISLIGEDYFKDKLVFDKSISYSYSGKDASSYAVIYGYFLGQVLVRLNSKGEIVSYQGPTKSYSFNINKEEAIRIAKSRGLQEPIDAQLVYGGTGFGSDTGSITESYMWDISSGRISEGSLEIVYIDIDSGNIIGVKTFERVYLREQIEEFNKTDKEYNQVVKETNKTNKEFNQSVEEVNKINKQYNQISAESSKDENLLEKVWSWLTSLFKK